MGSTSTQKVSHWKYDVFLSFRGEDTRKKFTDHLYAALDQKGVIIFRDDKELERGNSISLGLFKSIEESRILIIVFSRNYAESTWCLDELVKIVECKNTSDDEQIIYPIFYDVAPTVVRKQTGIFREAFAKHEQGFSENIEKVQKWRDALKEVANISGQELKDRNESEFISDIVKEISSKIPTKSEILKDLVGINSRLEEMRILMDERPDDVRFIGIWGMGGIGKTTLARVVYELFSHEFDGSSCLLDVSKISEREGSVLQLQKQLIFQLLKLEDKTIFNHYDGINIIGSRLRQKKVLLVIDDVVKTDQLERLAAKREWFGPGSRIIITSRDKHVLMAHGVDKVYELELLNFDEALQLFCTKAFQNPQPLEEYVELSKRVVNHVDRLPLALRVLGSSLIRSTKDQWESTISKLQTVPPTDIQGVLKISYDCLDEFEKNIFLDIACFFDGESENVVESFFDACGFFAKNGLKVLAERSLVTKSGFNNRISMHNLLRDMGREIVRQESTDDPAKRSRLWHHSDICKVFTQRKVSKQEAEAMEGISLDMSKVNEMISLNPGMFKMMSKLRFLKFYGENNFFVSSSQGVSKMVSKLSYGENKFIVSSSQGVRFLEVRYFEWHGCPMKMLNIPTEHLVSLKLHGSKVKQLWHGVPNIINLKEMDLSDSTRLKNLPDLSHAKNLERLILRDCSGLKEIHPSILYLDKLLVLNLKNCESLTSLPASIRSKSLEELELNFCSNLKNFPEISSSVIKLLFLCGCGIEELPPSVWHVPTSLIIYNCSNLRSLPEISPRNIQESDLNGSSGIEELPSSITRILYLNIGKCPLFESLPRDLYMLKNLTVLIL